MTDTVEVIVTAPDVVMVPTISGVRGEAIEVSAGPVVQVLALNSGPPGPAGRDGDGSGGSSYQFTASGALTTWTINHNLGRRVAVATYSTGGARVWGEVVHASLNQTLVLFDLPQAGYAVVN